MVYIRHRHSHSNTVNGNGTFLNVFKDYGNQFYAEFVFTTTWLNMVNVCLARNTQQVNDNSVAPRRSPKHPQTTYHVVQRQILCMYTIFCFVKSPSLQSTNELDSCWKKNIYVDLYWWIMLCSHLCIYVHTMFSICMCLFHRKYHDTRWRSIISSSHNIRDETSFFSSGYSTTRSAWYIFEFNDQIVLTIVRVQPICRHQIVITHVMISLSSKSQLGFNWNRITINNGNAKDHFLWYVMHIKIVLHIAEMLRHALSIIEIAPRITAYNYYPLFHY